MGLLVLAFLWCILTGIFRQKKESIAIKKSGDKRNYHIKSIFKHGLEWLKNVLVNIRQKRKEFFVLLRLLRESFKKVRSYCVVE